MTEQECLLQHLERWLAPDEDPEGHIRIRAAVDSPAHQRLASALVALVEGIEPCALATPMMAPC